MTEREIPRQRPVHQYHQELGAVTDSIVGWDLPLYYEHNEKRCDEFKLPDHVDGPAAIGVEVLSTRQDVGLHDGLVVTPIEIWGPSAPEFVQRAFTNDMAITSGQVRYTLLLDDDGRYMGDVIVTRLEDDRYLMLTAPSQVSRQTERLRDIAAGDVCIMDQDDGYTCIGVYGPKAKKVVQPLTDADLSRDAFPYFTSQQIEIAGVPVIANAVSYVGEFGWELWTRPGYEPHLWEALWEAGQDHSILPFGDIALFSMAVEKGFTPYETNLDQTIDMVSPANTPFEANLGHAIDMETDFVGKEALERAMDEGGDRRLCCITLDADLVLPDLRESVYAGGDDVGDVIRSDYGYTTQQNIVYAYLPNEFVEPGTRVEVESDGEQYPATVREEPLYDPGAERMIHDP